MHQGFRLMRSAWCIVPVISGTGVKTVELQDDQAIARERYYQLIGHFHCHDPERIELLIQDIRQLSPFWGMKARRRYKAWICKQRSWQEFWADQRRRRQEAKNKLKRLYEEVGGPPVEQEERKLVTTVNAAQPPADGKTVSGDDAEERPRRPENGP